MQTHPQVDAYFENLQQWQPELVWLRKIILTSGLQEAYKWKHPCYTWENKNVLMLGDFKSHCSIMFFQGANLKDPQSLLERGGDHTQFSRIFKCTNLAAAKKQKRLIQDLIEQAKKLQLEGAPLIKKKVPIIPHPPELKEAFQKSASFKKAFESLTPGRQRDYLILFTGSKESSTRAARIERNKDRIIKGYGRNDCTCGLSKRMPQCDGSHKSLRT